MANALIQNVTIARGEDVTLEFAITPTPQDLSGRTYGFQVKAHQGATANDEAFIDDEDVDVEYAEGVVSVPLTNALTKDLAIGTYFYWVWRTDTGSRRNSAAGVFRVIGAGRY